MRKSPLILALVLSSSLAFGQLDSNSITVTASRSNAPGPPDLLVFSVVVTSGLDTSLDAVIALLQGTGITAANLQSLDQSSLFNGSGPVTETLNWRFSFTAPLTKNKDTIAILTSLQQTIAKKNNGVTMSFSIQGTRTSVQPPQTCAQSDLLTDARTQAQKLADGAGVSVGNILAMSSSTYATCSLTVKFALLRY
jgi:uncharacterized protein YggE